MSRPTSGNKIIIVSRHDPGYASEREAALRGPPPARPGSASQKLTPLNLDQLSRGARPGTYFRESCELQLACSCADWQKL